MIGHEHEIARPKKAVYSAGSVGEQQIPDAIFREHPDANVTSAIV